MRGFVLCIAVIAAAVFTAVALAASQLHLPGAYYPGQTESSSSYSSAWKTESSYTPDSTDRTVTLIDNVSYSWHDTNRGTAESIQAHWWSSTGKKGYCKLHQGGQVGCAVFDF